jgi:hypothetical protein
VADVSVLFQALALKSKFEVVDHSPSANQLRIIGRIPSDAAGQYMQNWLVIARNLLLAQENGSKWHVDLSKQYFLKGAAGSKKIVYGHRLIIQAENVAQYYDEIIAVILESKPSAVTSVDSFPLPGADGTRNTPKNGKGAAGISSKGAG